MTERVVLHIGLPKTGTTYLQQILWENRDRLESDGVWLPGRDRREHLWAALECMGADLSRRPSRSAGALERLCQEVERGDRPTALISHEFFCGASRDQAALLLERLAPARVELIVTARDAGGMLAAGWQELVKNGGSLTLEQAAARESGSEFSWQTWDLGGVLERWAALLPADQVSVLPIPPRGSAPEQHWLNFAAALGVATEVDLPEAAVNTSLGVVQIELLRRVAPRLEEFKRRAVDRGQWIRGYLAETHLGAQHGERLSLPRSIAEECLARSRRAVDLIDGAGYRVIGDPASLLPADEAEPRRDPASVTDDELVAAASELIAAMLVDVRNLSAGSRDDGPVAGRARRGAVERLRRLGRATGRG